MAKKKNALKKNSSNVPLMDRLDYLCSTWKTEGFEIGRSIALTQAWDVMLITLHENFGFGPERVAKFKAAYELNWDELVLEGRKDTPDREYTKSIVDRRLQQAVPPELFVPWDQRYEYDLDPKTDYHVKDK